MRLTALAVTVCVALAVAIVAMAAVTTGTPKIVKTATGAPPGTAGTAVLVGTLRAVRVSAPPAYRGTLGIMDTEQAGAINLVTDDVATGNTLTQFFLTQKRFTLNASRLTAAPAGAPGLLANRDWYKAFTITAYAE